MATKQNPHNSTIVQALIELQRIGAPAAINDLLKWASSSPAAVAKADEALKRHEPADKDIEFFRRDKDIILIGLSKTAHELMEILCTAVPNTGYVSYSARDAADILKVSKNSITTATAELIEANCISIIRQAKGKAAAIYCVNPALAAVSTKRARAAQQSAFDGSRKATRDGLRKAQSVYRRELVKEEQRIGSSEQAIRYVKVSPILADNAKRAADNKVADSSPTTYSKTTTKNCVPSTETDVLDGQLSILDYDLDAELPFGGSDD